MHVHVPKAWNQKLPGRVYNMISIVRIGGSRGFIYRANVNNFIFLDHYLLLGRQSVYRIYYIDVIDNGLWCCGRLLGCLRFRASQ